MPAISHSVETNAYLLADHLDAMLATGEDLLKVRCSTGIERLEVGWLDALRDEAAIPHRFVDNVRTLELAFAMRALQARERADDLRRLDPRVNMVATLFVSGTVPLADAADELGDWTNVDFNSGTEVVSYLRSRAVIATDSIGVLAHEELTVTPRFLVARRIELGALMDLAATFLDALELFYELYDGDDDEDHAPLRPGPGRDRPTPRM